MEPYIYELSGGMLVVIGVAILCANPRRPVNRAVSASALVLALWSFLTYLGMSRTDGSNPAWLRAQGVVTALAIFVLLLASDTISGRRQPGAPDWCRRRAGFLAALAVLTILPLTDTYIPYGPHDETSSWNWGHVAFLLLGATISLSLLIETMRELRRLNGAPRLEMQAWVLTCCILSLCEFGLTLFRRYISFEVSNYITPVAAGIVPLGVAGIALAVARKKVFDAAHLLRTTLKHGLLLAVILGGIWAAWRTVEHYRLGLWVFCAAAAVVAWCGGSFKAVLDRIFDPRRTREAHRAIANLARSAVRREALIRSAVEIWKQWADVEHACILPLDADPKLEPGHPIVRALRATRWATPERLAREPNAGFGGELAQYLERENLGLVVFEETRSLSLVAGLGIKATRKPYGYGQVKQLREMTSALTGAMERIAAIEKAAQAERLAAIGLMGASVAHEIRNPVLAIKTFAQLLPDHHEDAEFRHQFFRVIKDEAERIDELTGQLVDLSAPAQPASWIEIQPAIESCLETVQGRGRQLQVIYRRSFNAAPDLVWASPSALKQALINLLLNSLHALETTTTSRWIAVSTRNVADGVEIVVEDNGPGISPKIWPRLFDLFHTSKSQGFGLGLAISRNLLGRHGATLVADRPTHGKGATFRIRFPAPKPPRPARAEPASSPIPGSGS